LHDVRLAVARGTPKEHARKRKKRAPRREAGVDQRQIHPVEQGLLDVEHSSANAGKTVSTVASTTLSDFAEVAFFGFGGMSRVLGVFVS
jgi:hypothetical protein